MLGLAKRDLWGLGAESWFVVASYANPSEYIDFLGAC